MVIKQGTLVQVDWHDAEATGEWTAIKDVEQTVSLVHSVGYVLFDKVDLLVLAGDVGDKYEPEQTVNRCITIPRGMIYKVRRIK